KRETANIISVSKIEKSWLAYSLVMSLATGRDWFGFPTSRGRVLLIDNELHQEILSYRLSPSGLRANSIRRAACKASSKKCAARDRAEKLMENFSLQADPIASRFWNWN